LGAMNRLIGKHRHRCKGMIISEKPTTSVVIQWNINSMWKLEITYNFLYPAVYRSRLSVLQVM
jgi:hypothetical protein